MAAPCGITGIQAEADGVTDAPAEADGEAEGDGDSDSEAEGDGVVDADSEAVQRGHGVSCKQQGCQKRQSKKCSRYLIRERQTLAA